MNHEHITPPASRWRSGVSINTTAAKINIEHSDLDTLDLSRAGQCICWLSKLQVQADVPL